MKWETRTDWYVDEQNVSGNANDNNSGATSTRPLASYDGLTRRIGNASIRQNTTIHLISDVDDDSCFIFRGTIYSPSVLTIIGEATEELYSGDLTGVQNIIVGATRPSITINGIDWTAAGPGGTSLIGYRARVTATVGGTQIDTIFWLEEVDGGDASTCFISQPYYSNVPALGAIETLAIGDTIVVENLTSAGRLDLEYNSNEIVSSSTYSSNIVLHSIKGQQADSFESHTVLGTTYRSQGVFCYGSHLNWATIKKGWGPISACRWGGGLSNYILSIGGDVLSLEALSADSNGSLLVTGGSVELINNCSFGRRLVLDLVTGTSTVTAIGGVSFWEWDGAAIDVGPNCVIRTFGAMWGSSSVSGSYGIRVRGLGSYAYFGVAPTISGAETYDINIGGVTDVYESLPAAGQNPEGNGSWLVTEKAVHVAWHKQTDWYVDEQNTSGNANDTNIGNTSGAPLASYTELTRRLKEATLRQDTTIHLISDVNDTSIFEFRGSIVDGYILRIQGEATVQLLPPTVLTNVQNIVVNTSRPSITIAGIDWTTAGPGGSSLIGKRARITATAGSTQINTIFWLEEVDGGDPTTCFISQPYYQDYPNFGSVESIASGDTVVVEELSKAGYLDLKPSGGIASAFDQIGIVLDSIKGVDSHNFFGTTYLGTNGVGVYSYGSSLNWDSITAGFWSAFACQTGKAAEFNFSRIETLNHLVFIACSFYNPIEGQLNFTGSGAVDLYNNCSAVGTNIVISAERGALQFRIQDSFSSWNWGKPLDGAFDVRSGTILILDDYLWGLSSVAGTYGIRIRSFGLVNFRNNRVPTVSGSASYDIDVGGVTDTYNNLPAAGDNPGHNNAWLVVDNLTNISWDKQTDWYVDEQNTSGNASDFNIGNTSGAPLASYKELTRRLKNATLGQDTTVHLISDVNDTSIFEFRGSIIDGYILRIIGEAPVELFSGTLTGVQNISVGSDRPYVQISGIDWATAGPGGTSLVGQRVRITVPAGSANPDTLFWLQEVDGYDSSICYISQPFFSSNPPAFGAIKTLAIGDQIVVEQLTSAGLLVLDPIGLTFQKSAGGFSSIGLIGIRGVEDLGTSVWLGNENTHCGAYGCWLNYPDITTNANWEATRQGQSAVSLVRFLGSGSYHGSYVTACSIHADGQAVQWISGSVQLFSNTSFQRCNLSVGAFDFGYTDIVHINVIENVSFWDWGSNLAAILVMPGSQVILHATAWGTSTRTGSFGIRVRTGGFVSYPNGTPPSIDGAAAFDVNIGGVQDTYANLPSAGQNPGNNNAWLVVSA